MTLAFFYDGPLYINAQKEIFGIAFNDKMFQRYELMCDRLILCMRQKQVSSPETLSKITLPYIEFVPCVNLATPAYFFKISEARKTISSVLEKVDGAIIRLPSMIGDIAVDLCVRNNIPFFVEVVGCTWDSLWNHSVKGKIMALPRLISTKKAVKKSPYVLYVTQNFLQNRYPTNGKSIGCSDVDIQNISEVVFDKRIKHIESHFGRLKIGTLAAVNVRYKGQQYVIEAIGKLKKQGIDNFEYHIAGNGDQSYLRSVAEKFNVSDRVFFTGGIPHEKVFDWLDSIDIYVQPSRTEGLPRAMAEAMSRALPVFGANTGGIPELVDKEYLFSNTGKNIDEICKILTSLTTESMLTQAKRSFEKASEYSPKVLNEKRENFYKDFLEYVNKCNNEGR